MPVDKYTVLYKLFAASQRTREERERKSEYARNRGTQRVRICNRLRARACCVTITSQMRSDDFYVSVAGKFVMKLPRSCNITSCSGTRFGKSHWHSYLGRFFRHGTCRVYATELRNGEDGVDRGCTSNGVEDRALLSNEIRTEFVHDDPIATKLE